METVATTPTFVLVTTVSDCPGSLFSEQKAMQCEGYSLVSTIDLRYP